MTRVALAALVSLLPLSAAAEEASSADLPSPSAELLARPARQPGGPSLHPPVVLRDQKVAPVVASGAPVDAGKTCDGCHDVAWIRSHDGHQGDPRGAGRAGRAANAWSGYDVTAENAINGNCFLCHVQTADNQARIAVVRSGQPGLAETATLAGTGLASKEGDGWTWHKEHFRPDGSVVSAALGLGRPSSRACGFCHGKVHVDDTPLALTEDPGQRMTELHGVVFSGQRISDSAVNLAGKSNLFRPWDVHAERLLSCASCHFSPNHPAYAHASQGPAHLQFDARRVSIAEYLRRPDHRLAKGASGEGAAAGTLRRCENCHDAPSTHRWLPRAELHFGVLLCESCHVPMAYAPARQEIDWTMLSAEGKPRTIYRGGDAQGFVTGFRPALLWRTCADGARKLAPNNLTTVYAWTRKVDGRTLPIERAVLEKAFLDRGAHRAELIRALDRNGDGKLEGGELALDGADKVKVARELLVAAGVGAPELSAEIVPHEIHHGVSPGSYAVRECSTCHTANSRLGEATLVSTSTPFGVTPTWSSALVGEAPGSLVHDDQGRVWFKPKLSGIHVFGHTRSRWLDWLGVLMVLGAFAGAGAHGLLRVRSSRRKGKEQS